MNETSRTMLGVVATCRDDEPYGSLSNSEIWRHLPGLFLVAVSAFVMALFYAQTPTAHITDLPISSPTPDPVAWSQEPPLVPDLSLIQSGHPYHLPVPSILISSSYPWTGLICPGCILRACFMLGPFFIWSSLCVGEQNTVRLLVQLFFFQPHNKPSHFGPNISFVPNSQNVLMSVVTPTQPQQQRKLQFCVKTPSLHQACCLFLTILCKDTLASSSLLSVPHNFV